MSTYDNIKQLCDERGIAVTALEKELGFGRGSIGKLKKNGTTSGERLQKIADYFGVPIEYLLTGRNFDQQKSYYVNEETAKMAQEIFETRGLRILFDAARNARPEDLETAAQLLQRLKETNPNG